MSPESENFLATKIHAHAAGHSSMSNSLLAVFGVSSKIGRAVDHPMADPVSVVEALHVVNVAAVEPSAAACRMIEAEIQPGRCKLKSMSQETLNAIDAYLAERAGLLDQVTAAVHESQARSVQWHVDRTARLRTLMGFGE